MHKTQRTKSCATQYFSSYQYQYIKAQRIHGCVFSHFWCQTEVYLLCCDQFFSDVVWPTLFEYYVQFLWQPTNSSLRKILTAAVTKLKTSINYNHPGVGNVWWFWYSGLWRIWELRQWYCSLKKDCMKHLMLIFAVVPVFIKAGNIWEHVWIQSIQNSNNTNSVSLSVLLRNPAKRRQPVGYFVKCRRVELRTSKETPCQRDFVLKELLHWS